MTTRFDWNHKFKRLKYYLGCWIKPYNRLSRVSDYFDSKLSKVSYVGWLGRDNLGDELLFDAIQSLFQEHSFISSERPCWNPFLKCSAHWIHPHFLKGSVLGGGTILSQKNLTSMMVHGTIEPLLATFGSGVIMDWETLDALKADQATKPLFTGDALILLQSAAFYGVRGPYSKMILERHGIKNVHVIGDPAIWSCSVRKVPKAKMKRIGINLGCENPAELPCSEEKLLDWMIVESRLWLDQGFEVIFVSMHNNDVLLGERWKKTLNDPKALHFSCYKNHDEIMAAMVSCDYFVGQRLHSVILSLASGVPALMLNYTPKGEDFLASIDLCVLGINLRILNQKVLHDKILWINEACLILNDDLQEKNKLWRERLHLGAIEAKKAMAKI
jgi:hypothetical protein